ncbi:MAG: hypothetical protein ACXW1Y_06425 [Acidimicrobiia bacterium]
MKRPLRIRGGILIGLLIVPLALYGAAQAHNATAEVALLVVFGLLALASARGVT